MNAEERKKEVASLTVEEKVALAKENWSVLADRFGLKTRNEAEKMRKLLLKDGQK